MLPSMLGDMPLSLKYGQRLHVDLGGEGEKVIHCETRKWIQILVSKVGLK